MPQVKIYKTNIRLMGESESIGELIERLTIECKGEGIMLETDEMRYYATLEDVKSEQEEVDIFREHALV